MEGFFAKQIQRAKDEVLRTAHNVVHPKEPLPPGFTPRKAEEASTHAARAAIEARDENIAVLETLTTEDALTGLDNRRGFDDHMKTEFSRLARTPGMSISVVICDADRFKEINDTYGHAAGDEILRRIAAVLKDGVRKADCVARLGGDEFALVLSETDEETALHLMERLGQKISKMKIPIGKSRFASIHMSIGIATARSADDTPEETFKKADAAMYVAKKRGNGSVVPTTIG